jgi:hypothetical protein
MLLLAAPDGHESSPIKVTTLRATHFRLIFACVIRFNKLSTYQPRPSQMRSIIFGLMCVMITASVIIYFAGDLQFHAAWATDVCRVLVGACESPWFVYAGAVAMLALYILARATEI